METDDFLSLSNFESILNQAYFQVTNGKGKSRHGQDSSFEEQPWKLISDNVGDGFCLGQAIKKLMELKFHSNAIESSQTEDEKDLAFKRWKTDALGAIVYTVMAIMYNEYTYSKGPIVKQ